MVVLLILFLLLGLSKDYGQLILVVVEVVLLEADLGVVPHSDTSLVVAEDSVLSNLGETAARDDEARPLVLINLVVGDKTAGVVEDDAVAVVIDNVVLDPTEPSLDGKDAFGPTLVDQVVQDDRVGRVDASEGDVCLEVLEDGVLLDVASARIHHQNALSIVAEDQVVDNLHIGSFLDPDSSLSVGTDVVVLLHSSVVLFASYA